MHLIFFNQIRSKTAFKHKTKLFYFTWLLIKNKCSSVLSDWGHKSFCKNKQQLAVELCDLKKVLFQILAKLSIAWLLSHQNWGGIYTHRLENSNKQEKIYLFPIIDSVLPLELQFSLLHLVLTLEGKATLTASPRLREEEYSSPHHRDQVILSLVVHFSHLQESNIPTMSLTISAVLLFYSSVVVTLLI